MIRWLSGFLVHHPCLVIFGITFVSITCAVIPFLMRPLPDFSDPQMGFETRGTELSDRLISWRNLEEATKPSGIFVINPKEFLDKKRFENEYFKPRKKKKNVYGKKKLMMDEEEPDRNDTENQNIYGKVITRNSSSSRARSHSNWTLLEKLIINNWDPRSKVHKLDAKTFFCEAPDEGYVQMVIASNHDLFTLRGMLEVCRLASLMEKVEPYQSLCVHRPAPLPYSAEAMHVHNNPHGDELASCCRPWNVPNYIAQLKLRPSCLAITEDDIESVKRLLATCAPYFHNLKLEPNCADRGQNCEVPARCAQHNAVFNVLNYLTSFEFAPPNMSDSNGKDKRNSLILHETMIFLPMASSYAAMPYFHNLEKQLYYLPNEEIRVVAMYLGDKYGLFDEYLLKDSKLMLLGAVLVVCLMWAYTGSIYVTTMTLAAILFALCHAFFIYTFCYRMDFFPFMNIMAFIVGIGVGADDAFIFFKIWTTVKRDDPDLNIERQLKITLELSLSSMAVTSATTAAAFMVSTLSAITAIRCFGIFAGTSVIINYVIMSLWLPSCFVVRDRLKKWWKNKKHVAQVPQLPTEPDPGDEESLFEQLLIRLRHRHPRPLRFNHTFISGRPANVSRSANNQPEPLLQENPLHFPAMSHRARPYRRRSAGRSICSDIRTFWTMCRQRFVTSPLEAVRLCILHVVTGPRHIPGAPVTSSSGWYYWISIPLFIGLSSVAVLAAVAVFYYPRLRLPDSREFQLFSDKHPFELYDMVYKNKFWFKRMEKDSTAAYKLPLRFVWGVLPIDDGNHLDPRSIGQLHMDRDFDISAPEAQQFLFNFCKALKRQTFYQSTRGPLLPNCFIESFMAWMERRRCEDLDGISREPCCETQQFPYNQTVFNQCIVEAMTDLYETPREFLMPGLAGPRFSKEDFPRISAVVVEYSSNYRFSLSYTEMHVFVNEVEEFFNDQLKLAPESMQRGWFISDVGFYDLQKSLSEDTIAAIYISMIVAFTILFASTLNIMTSIFAIISIVCSILVTLATLVLSGWKLNILESVAVSSAIGLAVDFSLHYTVKYNHHMQTGHASNRREATRRSLDQMLGPTCMAAVTTSAAGLAMFPSQILAYIQIGTFLVTVMAVSWFYATFHLGIMLAVAGPERNFGQFRYDRLCALFRKQHRRRSRQSSSQGGGSDMREEMGPRSRIDSHELETLTQTSDIALTSAISQVIVVPERHIVDDGAVAGPSGLGRGGPGGLCSGAHRPVARVMSNGSVVYRSGDQTPSDASVVTIMGD